MKISDSSLRLLALALIGLAAGPEIGLAVEMTTLLEIVGAVMFFMAFSVGARMLAADLAFALRDYVCHGFACRLSTPVMLIYVIPRLLYVGMTALVLGRFMLEMFTGKLW